MTSPIYDIGSKKISNPSTMTSGNYFIETLALNGVFGLTLTITAALAIMYFGGVSITLYNLMLLAMAFIITNLRLNLQLVAFGLLFSIESSRERQKLVKFFTNGFLSFFAFK